MAVGSAGRTIAVLSQILLNYSFVFLIFRLSDTEDLMASQTSSNNTCIFRNQEPNVISFYNDQQIREDVVEFPAGAVLVSRCVDIGKFAMIGETF